MKRNLFPVLLLFTVALCAALMAVWMIPQAPADAQGFVNRTVIRDSSDDSPYAYEKRFSGNALVYEVWVNAGAVDNTGALEVTLDAQAGAVYDRTLLDIEMGEGEYTTGTASVELPAGLYLVTGDTIAVEFANENTETVGLSITTSQ